MSKYLIKRSYQRQFKEDFFKAIFEETQAINRGEEIRIDPRDTPIRVSLAMSSKKATSYAKGQAFPKGLIDIAIKRFQEHGKKVLIVIADTDFLPKNKAVEGVVSKSLCRNFTKEDSNSHHHGTLCLASLAAIHDLYEGTMQPLFEIGAIEFAFDKVMRNGYGSTGEIIAGMKAQTPRDGFGLTIYSNSWGSASQINSQKTVINELARKGGNVVHIFAGGNAGKVGDGVEVDKVSYPAAYAYSIAAASISESKQWSPFSSPGPMIDFAIAGEQCLSLNKDGKPSIWNGTSQSCPYLAGLAGILFLIDPDKYNTHASVKAGLQTACVDIDELPAIAGKDNYTGHGLPWLLSLVKDEKEAAVVGTPTKESITFSITDATVKVDADQLKEFPQTGSLSGLAIAGKLKQI